MSNPVTFLLALTYHFKLIAVASAGVARWHADIIWEIREISLPAGRILLGETARSIELVNLMFRSSLVSDIVYLASLPYVRPPILTILFGMLNDL